MWNQYHLTNKMCSFPRQKRVGEMKEIQIKKRQFNMTLKVFILSIHNKEKKMLDTHSTEQWNDDDVLDLHAMFYCTNIKWNYDSKIQFITRVDD